MEFEECDRNIALRLAQSRCVALPLFGDRLWPHACGQIRRSVLRLLVNWLWLDLMGAIAQSVPTKLIAPSGQRKAIALSSERLRRS